MIFLKLFKNHSEYEAAQDSLILPNLSYCDEENETHYNPLIDNTITATFYVEDGSEPTQIMGYYMDSEDVDARKYFYEVTIDDEVQPTVEYAYLLEEGTHTIKYKLIDETKISYGSFTMCPNMISIEIPNSVETIEYAAFGEDINLTSITIPDGVTEIGEDTFHNCYSLSAISMGTGITSIGASAFYQCQSLTSITIPTSVTSIGSYAFESTPWYNNQPDGVVYAGKVAYKYKGTMPSSTNIILREDTLSIAGDAFYGCTGLTSVNIGNGVTTIGEGAFADCSGLTSVDIGSGVTDIGAYAFGYCQSLSSITCNATVPPRLDGNDTFRNTNWCPIYVPAESVNAYRNATNWDSYWERIMAIPE